MGSLAGLGGKTRGGLTGSWVYGKFSSFIFNPRNMRALPIMMLATELAFSGCDTKLETPTQPTAPVAEQAPVELEEAIDKCKLQSLKSLSGPEYTCLIAYRLQQSGGVGNMNLCVSNDLDPAGINDRVITLVKDCLDGKPQQ